MSKRALFKSWIVLGVLVCALFSQTAYADENSPAPRQLAVDHISAMVEGMATVEGYNYYYGFPDVSIDTLELGDPIPVYSQQEDSIVKTSYLWPVYSGQSVVAVCYESTDELGDIVFHMTTQYCDAINKGLEENEKCAVYGIEGDDEITVIAEQGEHASVPYTIQCQLDTQADYDFEFTKQNQRTALPLAPRESYVETGDPLSESYDDAAEENISTYSSGSLALGKYSNLVVPKVNQFSAPICWAACVESIGRYMTGTLPYDHRNIAIKAAGGLVAGNAQNIVNGFALFKYKNSDTQIGAVHYSGGLTDQRMKNWIGNGIPIYAGLQSSGRAGHGVVICGWSTNSSGVLVAQVMNPGHGAYESMTKTGSGTLALYYNNGWWSWTGRSVVLENWQRPLGGDSWAFMLNTGLRRTGWQSWKGSWYFFDKSNGFMRSNCWVQDEGKWYRLDSSGAMLTWWQKIGYYWYFLGTDGVMVTGWQKIDGKWFSFDSEGAMRTGWFKENGNWYYLRPAANTPGTGPEGSMLHSGTWTINGKAYTFDSSGVCLNP